MARADAKLKNMPREALEELWALRHPPDAETKALTLAAIAVMLPDAYGVSIGKSALAEFYQWLEVERRMWARERLIDQIKEVIAKDESLSPEQVRKAGQRLFMADGILERDVSKFATAAGLEGDDYRAGQKDRELAAREEANRIARERLHAATRSKIDAGLDALFEEIKGNARAVGLFQEIKSLVRKP